MLKNLSAVIVALVFMAGCTKLISTEQYVDVMATMGCKLALEGTPEGDKILTEKKITMEDIANFRKKMDPKKVTQITTDISTRVMACHGLRQ